MGKALERLLARTSARTSGEKKKRKPRRKTVEIEDPLVVRRRNIVKLKDASSEEVRDLKLQILEKLKDRPTYQKKKKVRNESIMPPGLAPIDYNPDESDDEDEPY